MMQKIRQVGYNNSSPLPTLAEGEVVPGLEVIKEVATLEFPIKDSKDGDEEERDEKDGDDANEEGGMYT